MVVYLDNGDRANEKKRLASLSQVLRRLYKAGLQVQMSKCIFMSPSAVNLGLL